MRKLSLMVAALFLFASAPAFAQDKTEPAPAGASGTTDSSGSMGSTKKKTSKKSSKKHHKKAAGAMGSGDGGM